MWSPDSQLGDSLDISAADFEVGTIAARRSQEKSGERQRRMALDKAPHASGRDAMKPTKIAASPEVMKVPQTNSVIIYFNKLSERTVFSSGVY